MGSFVIKYMGIAVFATIGCKQRDFNSDSSKQNLAVKPLSSFTDESSDSIFVTAGFLKQKILLLRKDKYLPRDIAEYVAGESQLKSMEFFMRETKVEKKSGQCWYYLSQSADGKKTTRLLSKNFVSIDGIEKILHDKVKNPQSDYDLAQWQKTRELIAENRDQFYGCLKSKTKCSLNDMLLTDVFVSLYVPSVVEAGKDKLFFFQNHPCPTTPKN